MLIDGAYLTGRDLAQIRQGESDVLDAVQMTGRHQVRLDRSRDALLTQKDHLQTTADELGQRIDALQKQLDTVNSYLRDTDNALRDVNQALDRGGY